MVVLYFYHEFLYPYVSILHSWPYVSVLAKTHMHIVNIHHYLNIGSPSLFSVKFKLLLLQKVAHSDHYSMTSQLVCWKHKGFSSPFIVVHKHVRQHSDPSSSLAVGYWTNLLLLQSLYLPFLTKQALTSTCLFFNHFPPDYINVSTQMDNTVQRKTINVKGR